LKAFQVSLAASINSPAKASGKEIHFLDLAASIIHFEAKNNCLFGLTSCGTWYIEPQTLFGLTSIFGIIFSIALSKIAFGFFCHLASIFLKVSFTNFIARLFFHFNIT
jgi:hypothetical protein